MADKGLVAKAVELALKGKSLSKNFKDSIIDKWAVKIENDADIDTYVDDRLDLLLEASAESDRVRLSAKPPVATPPVQTPVEPAVAPETDPMKLMLKAITDLTEKVGSFEKDKQRESIGSKFANDERVKGIPDFIRNGYIPANDDEYESKVTTLVEAFRPFAEQNKLAGFGGDTPASSTDTTASQGKVKEISIEDARKIVS